ncbi:efflux RND transporter periplasmic adaptor subunit [Ciceribacter sp. RN22]|uniref:efflux RND transporter periplasmic adaptor subunit n=1 Tax=Ciceribacter sp. RN22 TaxID=2954932 RepID=UPI002092538A|nr:efflux RND transporter periplasmic adaptor subunit [Ciceribacter sp. RN22]MCO6178703.1 efflux RND transporter periplasmic adaptor subunit [Ciceribacter sp. RN22]
MPLWKQVIVIFAVVAAFVVGWARFVPGAGDLLLRIGAPAGLVAVLAPAGETAGPDAKGGEGNRRGGNGAPVVVVQPVSLGTVNDRLSAIGTGDAVQSVAVTPQVDGTLAKVAIVSGQKVTRGDLLAQLDNDEQTIARDQARVALKSATEKANLYANLKSTVSRIDAFDAQIAVEAAKLALDTAELNLKRRDIVAPIDGIAGIITINPGDNVTTGTVIATLDDRSEILVDFWVPERFAPILKVGQAVEATAVARPGQLYRGTVEAIDNRIDEASRTLHVRARIANANDDLRAGMSFTVTMAFAGENYPSVDPLAVQWDGEGAFVWRVGSESKAEKVRVRIVQRNPDAVLVDAELRSGDRVVTEGIQRVRQGGTVRPAGEETGVPVASQ